MTSADTCNTDLLHLMTSARSQHDRAIGDFLHQIWQAFVEELTPAPVLELARRAHQARSPHPGH
ncbi:hypothetical protein [Zoogloea dura]|uniref:Uncharacterized protein n=1 Tax=Zoogloea dura TaxID=2728840 RepID=A0A848G9Q2_9RHOO|nr:hypothetical protein [Zoogloea dura]NML27882.1 hypothetical protein [Zoogloea dura]